MAGRAWHHDIPRCHTSSCKLNFYVLSQWWIAYLWRSTKPFCISAMLNLVNKTFLYFRNAKLTQPVLSSKSRTLLNEHKNVRHRDSPVYLQMTNKWCIQLLIMVNCLIVTIAQFPNCTIIFPVVFFANIFFFYRNTKYIFYFTNYFDAYYY